MFGSWTGDGVVLNWTVNDGVPSLVTAIFFDCDAVSLVRVLETMPTTGDTQDITSDSPPTVSCGCRLTWRRATPAGYTVGTGGAVGFGSRIVTRPRTRRRQ